MFWDSIPSILKPLKRPYSRSRCLRGTCVHRVALAEPDEAWSGGVAGAMLFWPAGLELCAGRADTLELALAYAYVNNPQLDSQRAVVRATDEACRRRSPATGRKR